MEEKKSFIKRVADFFSHPKWIIIVYAVIWFTLCLVFKWTLHGEALEHGIMSIMAAGQILPFITEIIWSRISKRSFDIPNAFAGLGGLWAGVGLAMFVQRLIEIILGIG